MNDLIAFLNARLDEDEAAARQAAQVAGPDWTWKTEVPEGYGEPTDYVTTPDGTLLLDTMGGIEGDAPHVARHDPARVLREVEAKRALLRMHQPVPFWGNNPPPLKDRTPENAVAWYCECQCPDGVIQGAYPCDTARLIAAVYRVDALAAHWVRSKNQFG